MSGPALVDSQLIAARFGLTAVPFIVTGGGGTNYANGSAQAVSTTAADAYVHGLYNNVPIVAQMSDYLASVHNVANPNALYMISYGGNDLIWLQLQGQNVAALPYLSIQAQSLIGGITRLQAAGARTIVVLDVYAKSKLVDANGGLSPANLAVVKQATAYSAEVWSGLKAAGVNFIPVDIENALTYACKSGSVWLHRKLGAGVEPGLRGHDGPGVCACRSGRAEREQEPTCGATRTT